MKEKLVIKNFGPIRSVELELGRFNVLIGEQATGKSTVAKVLAVCRYFSYIIGKRQADNTEDPFIGGLYDWGIKSYTKEESFISYDCSHYSFVAKRVFKNVASENVVAKNLAVWETSLTSLSQGFKNLLLEYNEIQATDNAIGIPYSFYRNNVTKIMDNPLYLPTERGLQSIFSLGSNPVFSNFLYSYFGKIDSFLKSFKDETSIEPLNIIYKNEQGRGFIKNDKQEEFLDLKNGASGYQSTIPVVLVIKDYLRKNRKKTFILEEPEMNLFPAAQNNLMQYLVDKIMNYGNNIVITTHSPYVLTSLNNMMYAYQVAKKHENEVAKEVEKQYWLNPDDVSAYMMLADGTSVDIVDREEGLIMAEKIDGISNILSKQFDSLLNIELAPHESDS